MAKFDLVATGGTFDIIHKGHFELLAKSFSISSKVIIGLTSDEMFKNIRKKCKNNYSKRHEVLESFLKNVQALVASEETSSKGKLLNSLRAEKNLSPVEIIIVPMVLAKDGSRISTTRIRNSEIDEEGNLS